VETSDGQKVDSRSGSRPRIQSLPVHPTKTIVLEGSEAAEKTALTDYSYSHSCCNQNSFSLAIFSRLLLAPDAQNGNRSRQQCETTDSQTWINFRSLQTACKSMGGSACAKRKTWRQKYVFEQILCHIQVPSGGCSKKMKYSKPGNF
jgi:hypothetical protein